MGETQQIAVQDIKAGMRYADGALEAVSDARVGEENGQRVILIDVRFLADGGLATRGYLPGHVQLVEVTR